MILQTTIIRRVAERGCKWRGLPEYIENWHAVLGFIDALMHFLGLCSAVFLLSALLAGPLSPALASATVKGLYGATVEVAGPGAEYRQHGFRLALQVVLSRLTGNGEIAATALLEPLLNDAQTHIAQFSYRDLEQPVGEDAVEVHHVVPIGADVDHLLEVHFVPASLNQSLSELGVLLWDTERPETLLWLAVQGTDGHYILTDSSGTDDRTILLRAAQMWGLPLLLPVMDLQDRDAVEFSDVYGGFSERVLNASARYGVESVLTGRMSQGAIGWTVDWLLYHDSRTYVWQTQSDRLDNVLEVGIQNLAEQLVSASSITTHQAQVSAVRLRIARVDSLDGYARVFNYLANLALVKSVNFTTITPEANYVHLNIFGDSDNLRRAVAFSSVLRVVDSIAGERTEDDSLLYYELAPVPSSYRYWRFGP